MMDNEESVYSSSKSAFCAYIWMENPHLGAVAAYFAGLVRCETPRHLDGDLRVAAHRAVAAQSERKDDAAAFFWQSALRLLSWSSRPTNMILTILLTQMLYQKADAGFSTILQKCKNCANLRRG